jgi:uncharacterized membrane protein
VSRTPKIQAEKRHLAKAITWRVVGTIDTFILSWIVTDNPLLGFKIGVSEVITKMTLYYFHERVWFNIKFDNSRLRHIFKTITWRIVGTLDTLFIAWILSGDIIVGMTIGGIEVITKMILYYLHERVWYRSDWGIEVIRNK